MGVASHLGINLAEYDQRIRTFIPFYEEMLDTAAAVLPRRARTIVDLGTGTGALAARCLKAVPQARVVGIDADGDILAVAARRLGARATFVVESFLRAPIPPSDAVVASFSLHHVRTEAAKLRLYQRVRRALRRGGRLLIVDCQPARDRALAQRQFAEWDAHLRRAYTPKRAQQLLAAWAGEDVYVPLERELALLRKAGFDSEVAWRREAFAVLSAAPRS